MIDDEQVREMLEGGRRLAVEKGWLSEAQATDAVEQIMGSVPPMSGGDGFHAPSAVSGSRASAMCWAEAISAAGKQLSDEGHEDEALGCFAISGQLLEKVERWGQV